MSRIAPFPFSVVRFRWIQGSFSAGQFAPSWGLDNVYVGMQCERSCSGRGSCVSGVLCECDDGYHGDTCDAAAPRPASLLEDFEGS